MHMVQLLMPYAYGVLKYISQTSPDPCHFKAPYMAPSIKFIY